MNRNSISNGHTQSTNDQWPMTNDHGSYYCSLIIFALLLSSFSGFSQDKPKGGDIEIDPHYATVRIRCSLIPVVSFYTPNTDYMSNTQNTLGLGVSCKAEFKLTRGATLKLVVGAEYLNEGMRFDSYYFAPGYSVLYDKNFNFTHSLHISELYIPILFKQGLNDEDAKVNSVYLSGGWAFRYVIGTNYKVTEKDNGQVVQQGFSPMLVEHHFLVDNAGSALLGGLGMEHKFPGRKRSVFFESYFHFNLSRIHYAGNNNSNNVKFRNHCLSLGVGYEF